MALNKGMSESSGCMSNISVQSVQRERVKQYSTAELIQARQKMAAPMHRDAAREKVVNSSCYLCLPLRLENFSPPVIESLESLV